MTRFIFEQRDPSRTVVRPSDHLPHGHVPHAGRRAASPPLQFQSPPPPAYLPRLSGEPPAALGPASASFLLQPTPMLDVLEPFLTRNECLALARASLSLRAAMRKSEMFRESERFARAFDAYLGLNGEAAYWQTCTEIAEARARRGITQPLLPALREAKRLLALGDDLTPEAVLASERQLVEAADQAATVDDAAGHLHSSIWGFVNCARTQSSPLALPPSTHRKFVRNSLRLLTYSLSHALTADLRPAEHPRQPARPLHNVVFVDHFANEPWTEGKMVQQSHIDAQGHTITKRLPWPAPDAGVTRLCFEFGPGPREVCSYVHTFNLPGADLQQVH